MLSKVLLVYLFVAVAVAAPPPFMRDQRPKRDVPCTSVISPQDINPAPSSSVILLNSPSAVGNIAGPQGPGSPPVINLNSPAPAPSPSFINLNAPGAPPPSPSIINLNRRQLSSLPPTSAFSFGGIVPSNTISSTPLSSSGTPAASSSPSFSFDGLVASSTFAPVSAATPSSGASNSTSTFSSTGPDGVKTVLLLSTTTVTVPGVACSSAPAFNPSQAFVFPPGFVSHSVILCTSGLPAPLVFLQPYIPRSRREHTGFVPNHHRPQFTFRDNHFRPRVFFQLCTCCQCHPGCLSRVRGRASAWHTCLL
ncbi:hypothetical protein F5888DRAFT_1377044 [Russula emetica]|nr:hypothetical protein F5888DRAFT_1377044 [Russula emetica]